jgi:NADP-dependent 3-hydroxy acid dehydrogenase YdfG
MNYLQDYPINAFEYLVKNNINSVFMMTKFALPYLQQTKGCVVSAGSESGLIGVAEKYALWRNKRLYPFFYERGSG